MASSLSTLLVFFFLCVAGSFASLRGGGGEGMEPMPGPKKERGVLVLFLFHGMLLKGKSPYLFLHFLYDQPCDWTLGPMTGQNMKFNIILK